MADKNAGTRETIRQLRVHEDKNRNTALGNIAGNCADIIEIQLNQIIRLEEELGRY